MSNLTDPAPDLVPHGARRLRRWRRQRRRDIAWAIVIGLILVTAGLVATDTIRIPSSESKPALAAETATDAGPGKAKTDIGDAATNTADAKVDQPPRALSPTDPLRLWIAGDSLSWAPGVSLGDLVAATGIVRAYLDSHQSTGLNGQQNLNWFRRATDAMSQRDPDQVIFTIGTNDWTKVASSPKDATGRPAWEATFRDQVARMMDLLVGGSRHRRVYWVGAPPMRDQAMNRAILQLNAIAAAEAAKRDGVTYIDAYKLFADSSGRYAASLPDPVTGKRLLLRGGDGVHFTGDGGDWLADELMRHLQKDWQLASQAVPGHPIPLTQGRDTTAQPGRFIQSTRSSRTTTSAGARKPVGAAATTSSTAEPTTTGATNTTEGATTTAPAVGSTTSASVTTAPATTSAPPTTGSPTTVSAPGP